MRRRVRMRELEKGEREIKQREGKRKYRKSGRGREKGMGKMR